MYPAGSRKLMASRLEEGLLSKHESLVDSAAQVWNPAGGSISMERDYRRISRLILDEANCV